MEPGDRLILGAMLALLLVILIALGWRFIDRVRARRRLSAILAANARGGGHAVSPVRAEQLKAEFREQTQRWHQQRAGSGE